MALLDKLRRVVVANRRRLGDAARSGARRFVSLSDEAAKRLQTTLQTVAPGRFGSVEVSSVIQPVTAAISRAGSAFGIDLAAAARDLGLSSSRLGRSDLLDQFGVWSTENPFAWSPPVVCRGTSLMPACWNTTNRAASVTGSKPF